MDSVGTNRSVFTAGSVDVDDGFVNAGSIYADGGATLNILARSNGFSTITNSGLMEAGAGMALTLHGVRAYTQNFATVDNSGTIQANTGTVDIQSNLHQSSGGRLIADNGGYITLEGSTDGGSIQLTDATLAFGLFGRGPYVGPYAAAFNTSPIQLGGASDILDFRSTGLSEVFNPDTNELIVSMPENLHGPVVQAADIHLIGNCSADDFSVHGTAIVYNPGHTNAGIDVLDTSLNHMVMASASAYSGPVAGLDRQYANISTENLNITATAPNIFLRSGSGMDGLNVSAVDGNNVLDGGTGSNFLTGGTGNDTFYVDDRTISNNLWSTVVNMHSGDNVTLWGLTQSDFTMTWLDGQGAAGFTGLTGVAVSSTAGRPEAGVTLAGMTSADLTNGKLTLSYGRTTDLPGVPGSDYLTIHAN